MKYNFMKYWFFILTILTISCSQSDEKTFVIEDISNSTQQLLESSSPIYSTFYIKIYGEVDGEFELELSTPENPKAMFFEKRKLKAGKYINYTLSTDLFHNYDVLFKYKPFNVQNGHLRIIWKGY
jgi:hypothetical protein